MSESSSENTLDRCLERDSDDEIVIISFNNYQSFQRVSFEDEEKMQSLANASLGAVIQVPGIKVEIQTYNSCLVHAIINATQLHSRLDEMLAHIQVVARKEGIDRTDIMIGMIAAKSLLNVTIRNGFDPKRDEKGIAHVHLIPSKIGHFIAIRRINGVLHIMDSLNGFISPILHEDVFFSRSTAYSIV